MNRAVYAVGDTVRLKPNILRTDADSTCRIVGVLPSDHGEVQYRVRMGNEMFERRILASDIDMSDVKVPQLVGKTPSSAGRNEPWLKPSSIRIKR